MAQDTSQFDAYLTPAEKRSLVDARVKALAIEGFKAALDAVEAEEREDREASAEAMTKRDEALASIQMLVPTQESVAVEAVAYLQVEQAL